MGKEQEREKGKRQISHVFYLIWNLYLTLSIHMNDVCLSTCMSICPLLNLASVSLLVDMKADWRLFRTNQKPVKELREYEKIRSKHEKDTKMYVFWNATMNVDKN